MNDLKFMKAPIFAEKYPNFRKLSQYVREIIVPQGSLKTQYLFGFKKTANDDLNKSIQSCRNLGVNPLEVEYTLRKTGIGKEVVYSIIAGQKVGLPQNVQQSYQTSQISTNQQQNFQNPIEPVKVPVTAPNAVTELSPKKIEIKFGISKAENQGFSDSKVQKNFGNEQKIVTLNDMESQIYAASCDYPEKLSESRYIELWNDCAKKYYNTIFEIKRIQEIYKGLYFVDSVGNGGG